MILRQTVPPAIEPITLDEAKLFARVDHDDENALLEVLISAAREQCENRIKRQLITATWKLIYNDFPCEPFYLFRGAPVQSVTSVKYYDTGGVQQTLVENTDYKVDYDGSPGKVYLPQGVSWPPVLSEPNTVEVIYVAGYGDTADDVPQSLKVWMRQAITTMYEYRETMVTGTIATELPRSFLDGLLDPCRVILF